MVAMVEVVVWLCWLLCAVVWGGGEWVDDGGNWQKWREVLGQTDGIL
jgi:hypothetical protein